MRSGAQMPDSEIRGSFHTLTALLITVLVDLSHAIGNLQYKRSWLRVGTTAMEKDYGRNNLAFAVYHNFFEKFESTFSGAMMNCRKPTLNLN